VLVLAGLCFLVTLLAREPLFGVDGVGFPLLVGGLVVGSAFLGLVRGILAARRRWTAAGLALVAENAARTVVAAVLLAAGTGSALLFGTVLVGAQATGLLWPSALRFRGGRTAPEAASGGKPWWSFVGGAASGQLISQLVLTGGPVVLAVSGAAQGDVTGMFAALALFRAPYTVAVGAVPQLTSRFTRQVVSGDRHGLTRTRVALGATTLLLAAAAVPVGAWVGPPLVALVFGADVQVAATVCGLLAAGSVLALGGLVATALVMAGGATRALAAAWSCGVTTAVVVLALTDRGSEAVAVAFALAEAVAFLLLLVGATPRRGGRRQG
jgi:O-antigen/teichoic acid export membrane protein